MMVMPTKLNENYLIASKVIRWDTHTHRHDDAIKRTSLYKYSKVSAHLSSFVVSTVERNSVASFIFALVCWC
jgi:hypothetical protein